MQMRAGVAKKTIRSIRQQAFEATHLFDSHPESSLDFEKVRAAVKDGYDRPFLLIDSTIVREKTRRFTAAMPRVLPHYAVKANPDPRILKLMLEQIGRASCRARVEIWLETESARAIGMREIDAARTLRNEGT